MATKQGNNQEPEIVTLKTALEITGFSRTTFNRRMAAGDITPLPKPAGLIKRHVLQFNRVDVERLLHSTP